MNKNKYLIIYHKEDNDGLFSMAIIYNYLINELKVNTTDINIEGHDYNSVNALNIESLINNYENIIMTDLSMHGDSMQKIFSSIKGEFTWIDHHAPIIKDSVINGFDKINGLRDTTRSAILNAYKYLYDPLDEQYNIKDDTEGGLPEYFRILSAWDSFSYKREGYELDFVRNVNVGTNTKYKLDPIDIIRVVYDIIYKKYASSAHSMGVKKLEEFGKVINDAKDAEYADIIKNVGDFTWTVNGRPSCALFIQGPSNSLIFKSVPENITNGIVFKRNRIGNWTMSVYNVSTDYDKDFHCGNYLKKKYNGGGHAGASGCQISQETFIELLKTHKI